MHDLQRQFEYVLMFSTVELTIYSCIYAYIRECFLLWPVFAQLLYDNMGLFHEACL